MKNVFHKKYLSIIIFLLFHICAGMKQDAPLCYNITTNSFGVTALKDIAAKNIATNLMALCSGITDTNISLLYDTIQRYLQEAPEELKEFIVQHIFYQCWQHSYKVAYTLDSKPTSISEYSISEICRKKLALSKNSSDSHEHIFIFDQSILCYALSPDNLLFAVALGNYTIQLFKNIDNEWIFIKDSMLEKPDNTWYYSNVQFLGSTLIARFNNMLVTISLEDQKLCTKRFGFTICRMYTRSENHFFIGGYNERVYSCKNINARWRFFVITRNNDPHSYFFPSCDGQSCITLENNTTYIYSADEYNKWHKIRPIRLAISTDNVCYYNNDIVGFLRFKFKSLQPIRPRPLAELVTFYNVRFNQIIGEFKRKFVNNVALSFDLNPPLTAILAAMVFSQCKKNTDALKKLKDCPFLTQEPALVPEAYKDQLDSKINKKLKKLCSAET